MTEKYLVETKKALEIVEREAEAKMREITPLDRLRLLNKMLPEVKDFAQYEELQKKKAALEFQIQAGGTFTFVPKDAKERIEANRQIELAELHAVVAEKHKELAKHMQFIEKEMLPLLHELNQLHGQENSVSRLDKYLNATYGYLGTGQISALYYPTSGAKWSARDYDLENRLKAVLKRYKGV